MRMPMTFKQVYLLPAPRPQCKGLETKKDSIFDYIKQMEFYREMMGVQSGIPRSFFTAKQISGREERIISWDIEIKLPTPVVYVDHITII